MQHRTVPEIDTGTEPYIGLCDVCVLVYHNKECKPVVYCQFCRAWLCVECKDKYGARGVAAIFKAAQKVYHSLVVETEQSQGV